MISLTLTAKMDTSYYKINKYLYCTIGQWPTQTILKKIFFTFTIALNLLSLLLGVVLGLVKVWGNIDDIIKGLPSFLVIVASIIYLIASCFNKKKMSLILLKIKNDWSTWTTGTELKILKEYANQGRKYVHVYSILMLLNMIDFLGSPLIQPFMDFILPLNESRPRRLIIETDYLIIDQDANYYWIALHTCLSTTAVTIVVVGIDSMFIAVIYHACGELAILRFKLKNLTNMEKNLPKRNIYEEIKFCARKHNSVIIFVKDITDYFSIPSFIVLGINILMISVTGVQTVVNLNNPKDALTSAMFTLGQIFHLFYLTVPCQYLTDHSIKLSESIYDGYWYEMPIGSQKLLLMIMLRSTKPCSFIAGSLYTFSMENFSSVVQKSMSYFTVLLSTVVNLNNPNDALTSAMFTLGQIFHLFYLTVPCQYLTDNSIKLSESIYDGYWYEMPIGSQKLLLMIMLRSTRPCSFIAGNLYTFSMENFSSTVVNLNNPKDAFTSAVFTLGQIFHIFYITVPCQHLTDHSIKLSESIYDGFWYEMPVGSRKLLLMIMLRSTRPCSFIAGNLYTFSMENFSSQSDQSNIDYTKMDRSYYKINKYLFCSIGQWPYQTKFKQILITLTVSFYVITLLIGEILGLLKAWGNLDDVINCMPPIFFIIGSIIYFITSCFNKKKLALILSTINNDWSIWTTGTELKILRQYANQGRKYVYVYSFLMLLNMIDFLGHPLIPPLMDLILPLNESRIKRLIIETDYLIIDQNDNYYWISLHTSVSVTLLLLVVLSMDSMFIVVFYHACGELAILGFKLKNLTKLDVNMSKINIYQEIKFCAKKHKSVIKFINDITGYFSISTFIILGINMIMISVTGVQTVVNLNKLNDAYTYAFFTMGQIIHIFCLTLPCQYLIDHSVKLSDSIYDGYWYEMPLGSQKLLLMIMMRSTKPCSFIAGRVYKFSMENFTAVVKTSMSYFTVFLSARK
ncbi:uncharacterized protein LOC127277145 [Leptopilina boulardi]|uniref:uncharacterized protein LOC127277145 n=1 Tax=Leptopilina boulardi TaxID=63433 RepID=UPI0021F558BE|nr:uncharacterized protein LOC127277145 [Leptopilina boulardi]